MNVKREIDRIRSDLTKLWEKVSPEAAEATRERRPFPDLGALTDLEGALFDARCALRAAADYCRSDLDVPE